MMNDVAMALDRERDSLLDPNWDQAPAQADEAVAPESRKVLEERARTQADSAVSAPKAPAVDVVNAPLQENSKDVLPKQDPATAAQTPETAEHAISHAPEHAPEEGDGGKVEAVLASAEKMPAAAGAPAAAPSPASAETAAQTAAPAQAPTPATSHPQQAAPAAQKAAPTASTQAPATNAPAGADKAGPPTGSDSWSRFVFAVGQNESGWRPGQMKNGEEIIGAGTTGTSGMDASYGRFQTTADSAIDVMRQHPAVAKQFGFEKPETAELAAKVSAVQTWWNVIMKGKAGGGFTAEDVQLAQQLDPEPFKTKWGSKWTTATGLGVADLDRLLATVQFRAVIEHYAPPKKKIKDAKERRRIAEKIFNENPALFARLGGMQAKDLTGFLKMNMMLENLAGFQMKAAGGEGGHLFKAINQNAGLDFGMSELKSVRDAVEAKATALGVKIQSDKHLYMLCARAHNKGMSTLSRDNFTDPNTLLNDDYVKEMLAGYESGPSKSQVAAMKAGAAAVTPSAAPAKTNGAPAAHTVPARAAASPTAAQAAAQVHFPDVKPHHAGVGNNQALTYELYKKEALSLAARVYQNQMTTPQALAEFASFATSQEGGVSKLAAGVDGILKQLLPSTPAAHNGTPATAPVAAHTATAATAASHATTGGAAVAIPKASAGFHDGGKDKALGAGDEVFDTSGREVMKAFPSTAEGVVEAAFYELHRGDKRSLADIMQDETRGKTNRGANAAIEGRESYVGKDGKKHTEGTNDDAAGHQVVGHIGAKVDRKTGEKISEGSAVGPIEAYVHSVGAKPGIAWCGSFATFVYLRAGIHVDSLAYSLNVPNVLARSEANGQQGAYYHMTGKEGSARIGGSKAYSGEFQQGEHAEKGVKGKTGEHYRAAKPKTGHDFDVRAGDVFWQQHTASSGHVGIIVGVEKTEHAVTCVTIEGNASDQVISRVHKIEIDAKGNVTAGFKGWGRPAELAGGGDAGGDARWIDAVASQGSHDIHDR